MKTIKKFYNSILMNFNIILTLSIILLLILYFIQIEPFVSCNPGEICFNNNNESVMKLISITKFIIKTIQTNDKEDKFKMFI